MRPHPEIKFTYREYALLPDDGRRHELVDGDFYRTPAPTTTHQSVLSNLFSALIRQLQETGTAEIFCAPVDVILADTTVVQPDLLAVRNNHRELIHLRGIEGPPNLVVEILSPGTRGNDEMLKRAVYARFAIPEYWIVDSDHSSVMVLRAESPGAPYTLVARFDRASTLTSVEFPELAIALGPIFP